jgi:hypothetical protein
MWVLVPRSLMLNSKMLMISSFLSSKQTLLTVVMLCQAIVGMTVMTAGWHLISNANVN